MPPEAPYRPSVSQYVALREMLYNGHTLDELHFERIDGFMYFVCGDNEYRMDIRGNVSINRGWKFHRTREELKSGSRL